MEKINEDLEDYKDQFDLDGLEEYLLNNEPDDEDDYDDEPEEVTEVDNLDIIEAQKREIGEMQQLIDDLE